MPPLKKKTICKGCGKVIEAGEKIRCEACQKKVDDRIAARYKEIDKERGSPSARGYDFKWTQFRRAYLREHPLCVVCESNGWYTPATEIHHIKMLRDGGDKYDPDNLMPLCHNCHSKITVRETGFGRW